MAQLQNVYQITITLAIIIIYVSGSVQSATARCTKREFQCINGQCIKGHQVCDGAIDCSDSSDETANTCISFRCPVYAFRCTYGGCIDGTFECDGIKHCADNSDELSINCKKVHFDLKGNCTAGKYQCSSGECIQESKLCDGIKDCRDTSDETVERCANAFCPAYGFRCGYGACVDGDAKCNRNIDCVDGSDESYALCGYNLPTTPSPTDYPPIIPIAPPGSCYLRNIQNNIRVSYASNTDKELYNGDYIESFSTITYSCRGKLKLTGSDRADCIEGDLIQEIPPKCIPRCSSVALAGITTRATCEYQGQPISCNSNLLPGTIARLTCNYGYRKPDREVTDILRCDKDGEWDYPAFKCEQICGVEAPEGTPYIVGGVPTNNTKVPWHIGVYSNIRPNRTFEQICGGTILNAKVIISAAHCFWDNGENKFYDESNFQIGTAKYFRDYYASEPLKTQFFEIAEIAHSPQYIDKEGLYNADIAILVLKEFIRLSEFVKPICINTNLQYNEKIVPADWVGRVAGWGLEESGGKPSPVLKVIELPSIDYNKCKADSDVTFIKYVTSDKFCAGYKTGLSVCQGDSGGGLVFPKNTLNELGEKVYYLRGIVSVGGNKQGSCNSDTYTTFTNIQFYIDFITEKMTNNRP